MRPQAVNGISVTPKTITPRVVVRYKAQQNLLSLQPGKHT